MFKALLGAVLLVWGSLATAQTVRTADELRRTLSQATAGTVITLTAGDYGVLHWQGGRGITVIGLAGAVLRGLDLRGARDIRLEGITFDYTFAPSDPPHMRPFAVSDSQGVTFAQVTFDGDDGANGYPTAYGLNITDSRDVTVKDSRLTGFVRGMVVANTQGLRITGNDVSGMRSDGLNFAQVSDVQITGNDIHDFDRDLANSDHADMIQFWTNGTTAPSRNIVIADNILNAGAGAYSQSIFMRNELVDRGLAGDAMFYRDVSITGNIIMNAHTHGITVGETKGLLIARNTVVQNPDAAGGTDNPSLWVPRIRVAADARDVAITGNVVAGIAGYDGQAGWQVADNLIVQNTDRGATGYYGAVFGAAAFSDPANPASYRLSGQAVGSGLLATP